MTEVNYVNLFKAEKILEKNWDIDLSARLTEYLKHLDSIDGGVSRKKRSRKRRHDEVGQNDEDIGEESEEESGEESGEDVDGSDSGECPSPVLDAPRSRINFAEAAAVIQGCAEIYGKKVDFVYQRTMKFQTLIAAGQEASVEKKAGKKERTDEFRRKIKTMGDRACEMLDFNLLETTKRKAISLCMRPCKIEWNTRIETSKRKAILLTKLLMEFVPLRPDEKRELAVHCGSKNREIFGNADDFKVNRFVPGATGAMVLRIQNMEFINEFTDKEAWDGDDEDDSRLMTANDDNDMAVDLDDQMYSAPPMSCAMQSQLMGQRPSGGSLAFEHVRDGTVYGNRFSQPAELPVPSPLPLCSLSAADIPDMNDLPVPTLSYAEHDVTDRVKFKNREQKTGKTFIPAMKERERRDVLIQKIAAEEGKTRVSHSLTNFLQELSRDTRVLEKKSLRFADRAPFLSDPLAVMMQTCISKQMKKREMRKKLVDEGHEKWLIGQTRVGRSQFNETTVIEGRAPSHFEGRAPSHFEGRAPSHFEERAPSHFEERAPSPFEERAPSPDYDMPDQDILVAADQEIAMDYSHVFNDPPETDEPLLGDFRASPTQNNNTAFAGRLYDNDNEDDVMSDFNFLGDPNDPFLVLPKPIAELSMNELVRFRVHEFWQIPKDHMTKLMVRVQDWEEKMVPFLDEELERREFRIHDYGTEILEKFNDIGEKRPFVDIVQGVERHEVSRYFLSALMLTNTYNVQTNDESDELGLEGAVNTMKLQFLKKDRHHECFEAGSDFLQGNNAT